MSWALIHSGEELKRHSTRHACVIEAIERGLATYWAPDFPGDQPGHSLDTGVEIIEVEDD